MDVHLAGPEDVADLARLLWLFAAPDEQVRRSPDAFASDVADWYAAHRDSHTAFLGRLPRAGAVGIAWVALLPRAPRPGVTVDSAPLAVPLYQRLGFAASGLLLQRPAD